MPKQIDAATLKDWIGDGRELAILDAREEGEFGRSHLFWAVPCPLSKMEFRARTLLPRRAARVVCVDGGEGYAARLAAYLEGIGCTAPQTQRTRRGEQGKRRKQQQCGNFTRSVSPGQQ